MIYQQCGVRCHLNRLSRCLTGHAPTGEYARRILKNEDFARCWCFPLVRRERAEEQRARMEAVQRERERLWRIQQEEKRREEERRKREEVAQRKLRSMGVCAAGYRWIPEGGGYRCEAGGHFVSNAQLGL